jgi:hypothetical protein
MTHTEVDLLTVLKQRGNTAEDLEVFGAELFVVAEKVAEKTLSSHLTDQERWPAWLYSPHAAYHRRPAVFPIVVADDYC